jgi:lysophospholipase L1-like esterase
MDSVESFAATRVYTLDGCHPNYQGYKVMTKIIADYINK